MLQATMMLSQWLMYIAFTIIQVSNVNALEVDVSQLHQILAQTEIKFPQLQLPNLNGATATLDNVVCNGLGITESAELERSGNGVLFTLEGVTFDCDVTVAASGGSLLLPKSDLLVRFAATTASPMALQFRYTADTSNNGFALLVDQCSMNIIPTIDIDAPSAGFFTNLLLNFASGLINLFSPVIVATMEQTLCGYITELGTVYLVPKDVQEGTPLSTIEKASMVDGVATMLQARASHTATQGYGTDEPDASWSYMLDYVTNSFWDSAGTVTLDDDVEPDFFVRQASPIVDALYPQNRTFNFQTDKNYRGIMKVFNRFLGEPLSPGSENLPIRVALQRIGEAIGNQGGAANGELRFGNLIDFLLPEFTIPLPGGYSASLLARDVVLNGVDTLTKFDVLNPSSESSTTLDSQLAADSTGIDLTLTVNVTRAQGFSAGANNDYVGIGPAPEDFQDTIGPDGNRVKKVHVPSDIVLPASILGNQKLDSGSPVWTAVSPEQGFRVEQLAQLGDGSKPSILVTGIPDVFFDSLRISLRLEEVEVLFSLLLAVDKETFAQLPFGGILKSNILRPMFCIASALYTARVPKFEMKARFPTGLGPQALRFETDKYPEVAQLGNAILDIVFEILQGVIDTSPKVSTGSIVGGLVQQFLDYAVLNAVRVANLDRKQACKFDNVINSTTLYTSGGSVLASGPFVDLEYFGPQKSEFPVNLDWFLNTFMSPNGELGMNRLFDIIGEENSGVAGTIQLGQLNARSVNSNELPYSTVDEGLLTDFGIRAPGEFSFRTRFFLRNFSTITNDTILLRPINSFATFTRFGISSTEQFTFAAEHYLSADRNLFLPNPKYPEDQSIRYDNWMQLTLPSLSQLETETLFAIDDLLLKNSGLKDVADACVLDLVRTIALLSLDINITQVSLSTRSCDYPDVAGCWNNAPRKIEEFMASKSGQDWFLSTLQNTIIPFVVAVVTDEGIWATTKEDILIGLFGVCEREFPSVATNNFPLATAAVATFGIAAVFLGVYAGFTIRNSRMDLANDTGATTTTANKPSLIARARTSVVVWKDSIQNDHNSLYHTDKYSSCMTILLLLATTAITIIAYLLLTDTTLATVVTFDDLVSRKIMGTTENVRDSNLLSMSTMVAILFSQESYFAVITFVLLTIGFPMLRLVFILAALIIPRSRLSLQSRDRLLVLSRNMTTWSLLMPVTYTIVLIIAQAEVIIEIPDDPGNEVAKAKIFASPTVGVPLLVFSALLYFWATERAMRIHRADIRAYLGMHGSKANGGDESGMSSFGFRSDESSAWRLSGSTFLGKWRSPFRSASSDQTGSVKGGVSNGPPSSYALRVPDGTRSVMQMMSSEYTFYQNLAGRSDLSSNPSAQTFSSSGKSLTSEPESSKIASGSHEAMNKSSKASNSMISFSDSEISDGEASFIVTTVGLGVLMASLFLGCLGTLIAVMVLPSYNVRFQGMLNTFTNLYSNDLTIFEQIVLRYLDTLDTVIDGDFAVFLFYTSQITMLLMLVFAPLLLFGLLSALFFAPLTPTQQRQMLEWCDRLSALSLPGPTLLAIILIASQIDKGVFNYGFNQAFLGSFCGPSGEDLLTDQGNSTAMGTVASRAALAAGVIDQEAFVDEIESSCLYISSVWGPGFVILFIATIMLGVARTAISKHARSALVARAHYTLQKNSGYSRGLFKVDMAAATSATYLLWSQRNELWVWEAIGNIGFRMFAGLGCIHVSGNSGRYLSSFGSSAHSSSIDVRQVERGSTNTMRTFARSTSGFLPSYLSQHSDGTLTSVGPKYQVSPSTTQSSDPSIHTLSIPESVEGVSHPSSTSSGTSKASSDVTPRSASRRAKKQNTVGRAGRALSNLPETAPHHSKETKVQEADGSYRWSSVPRGRIGWSASRPSKSSKRSTKSSQGKFYLKGPKLLPSMSEVPRDESWALSSAGPNSYRWSSSNLTGKDISRDSEDDKRTLSSGDYL